MYQEPDHPRAPKGTPQGGQFTVKAGVGTDEDLDLGEVLPEEEQRLPFDYIHVDQRSLQSAVKIRKRTIGSEYTFYDGVQRFIPQAGNKDVFAQYVGHDVQITLPDNASEQAWQQSFAWAMRTHQPYGWKDDMSLQDAQTLASEQRQWLARTIDAEANVFQRNNADVLSADQQAQVRRFVEGAKREYASQLQLHGDFELHENRVRTATRTAFEGGAWEDMYVD